ncbi:MAG TPA: hypothetical protein DD640_08270 [Clostridiales bacterium]|nr:hypothetical protein [Clostridiales bacterium]
MKCGFFEHDITPKLGMNLPGYFVLRPGTGILDRPQVRAMALENGAGSCIVISADCLKVTREMTVRVREEVSRATGAAPDHIMFCATHAHTGGPLQGFCTDRDDAPHPYADFLCDRAADAAVLAWQARVPAKIGFGSGSEGGISFIRRYLMCDGTIRTNPCFNHPDIVRQAGEIDPEVSVIRVDDLAGNTIGIVTNFACHCDTISGNSFSADYPGELHRTLKRVYGEQMVSIFLSGATGNIGNCDYQSPEGQAYFKTLKPRYQMMGRILAGEVIKVLERMTRLADDLPIAVRECSIEAGIRQPSAEDISQARAWLAGHPLVEHKIYHKSDLWPCEDSYFAEGVLYVAGLPEKKCTLTMQVVKLGGTAAIIGLPCELFVELGREIKKGAGCKNVYLSTTTNDDQGYVAVREAYAQGGYETRINKTTKLEAGTGEQMVRAVLAALRDL